jgi:hypothetical protein
MPKTGYRPAPIIAKLREADVLHGQGKTVVEGVKALGVTEVTYQPIQGRNNMPSSACEAEPR